MRPSKRFLIFVALWFVLACLAGLAKLYASTTVAAAVTTLFWCAGLVLAALSFADYYFGRRDPKLHVRRVLPAGFSVGTDNNYELELSNQGGRPLLFTAHEKVGPQLIIEGFPLALTLQTSENVHLTLKVFPSYRGTAIFHGLDTLIESRWRFWLRRCVYLEPESVRVFPNFRAVSNFELLTNGRVAGQLGVHLNQRRGEGLDFHQLREFRPGDSLRQVDWKATSRALKPISREFQDEKDQDILFLIDNGRRMRAKDAGLSHFDHCLNAFLLTAYVALRQGDAVGFQVFGGDERWSKPIKGRNNLNSLMHQVYDLHTSTATSDYLQAAEKLMDRHRKRSLVIIISNVSGSDTDDLLSAYELLRKNHLVMFACLEEVGTKTLLEKPVENFEQALVYSSATEQAIKRETMLKRLVSERAVVIDKPPSQLHIAMVNEYFALKRSGRI